MVRSIGIVDSVQLIETSIFCAVENIKTKNVYISEMRANPLTSDHEQGRDKSERSSQERALASSWRDQRALSRPLRMGTSVDYEAIEEI